MSAYSKAWPNWLKAISIISSSLKMLKVGSKGGPTAKSFKLAANTAKKVKKKTA